MWLALAFLLRQAGHGVKVKTTTSPGVELGVGLGRYGGGGLLGVTAKPGEQRAHAAMVDARIGSTAGAERVGVAVGDLVLVHQLLEVETADAESADDHVGAHAA